MHDDFHFILVIDCKLDFVNLVAYGLKCFILPWAVHYQTDILILKRF